MDSKGEESKMSYPNIFFMIDNFEEVRPSLCLSLSHPLSHPPSLSSGAGFNALACHLCRCSVT